MAPKLHTSQIFKGRAYQLKFRVYWFCLNKQHACKFTLVSRSDFFETRKKLLHSWNLQEFKDHSTQTASKTQPLNSASAVFLCVAERHAIFLLFHMFLWCSFTNNAWSHAINKRNQNKTGAKALGMSIYLWRSTQDAIISDVIIYPEMDISRTDREETSKLISNFTFSPAWSAYVLVLDVQFIDQFSEFSLILTQILKNKVTIRAAEFSWY